MSRESLPQRRANESFLFEYPPDAPQRYTVMLGYYDDGRLGEVFLNSAKIGSAVATNAADASVLLSMALQFGATLADLREAPFARDSQGRPHGLIGALVDLLAEREAGA